MKTFTPSPMTSLEVYEFAKENNLSFKAFTILLETNEFKIIHDISHQEIKNRLIGQRANENEFEKL